MKKKVIIIVTVILALVLFFPVPFTSYDDGGTREFKALTYKIVKWNRMQADDLIYNTTRIYFFPNNLKSIDELWKEIDPDTEITPDPTETAVEGSRLIFPVGDSFGLSMQFVPNGNRGGKLIFRQSQDSEASHRKLYTGPEFTLEASYNGKWVSYTEYLQKAFDYDYIEKEVVWTSQVYLIPENDALEMDIGFINIYGELEKGKYRICKTVRNYVNPDNFDEHTYYAGFSVE